MHGCLLALVSSLPSLLGCEAAFATAGAALEPKSLAVEAPEETSRINTHEPQQDKQEIYAVEMQNA